MPDLTGAMLENRYEILAKIGSGGMADVYRARDHRLNRLDAVKVLKPELSSDADFVRRFHAESQAVALLSHPNIVSVYDVSRDGDLEYIVMELIDGITLKQYMTKRGLMNWRESLHFITQIMRGLSHAHSRGVVHRDIKPQNIMILRDGTVKVADFGIAFLENNSSQTLTQDALGSVHYISPEQAKGDHVDARSDIYSAGVVMYEMLTGRLPFEGASAVSVALQHLSSVPLAPSEINPDIPPQLEQICMHAMESNLRRRYQTAEEMIADLERFRKNPNEDISFIPPDEDENDVTQVLDTKKIKEQEELERQKPPVRRVQPRRTQEEQGWKGTQMVLIIIIAILALALAGILLHHLINSFGQTVSAVTPAEPTAESVQNEQFLVPSVTSLTIEEANEREDVKNIFTLEVAGTETSDRYPVNTILRQEPAAGEYRKGNNLVIRVWISTGEDIGQMLDITGQTPAQAKITMKSLIKTYELTFTENEADQMFSDTVEAGFIIATDPGPYEEIRKGDTIRLFVSKGKEIIESPVPNFIGKDIDQVLQQLKTTWKLTCTEADITYEENDAAKGTILWQSIPETNMAKEWDTIQFRVSSGPPPEPEYYIVTENYVLPQDERESVRVTVEVNGEIQFDQMVNCSQEIVSVPLRGKDLMTVDYYFDGSLQRTYDLQFS